MSSKTFTSAYNQAKSIYHHRHNAGNPMMMHKRGSPGYLEVKKIEAQIKSGQIPSRVVKKARKSKPKVTTTTPVEFQDFTPDPDPVYIPPARPQPSAPADPNPSPAPEALVLPKPSRTTDFHKRLADQRSKNREKILRYK